MQVQTRGNKAEPVRFDQITERLSNLVRACGLNDKIDPAVITQKIAHRVHDGIKTREIDDLSAYICAGMTLENPEYGILAGRIAIDNHQKNTSPSFLCVVKILRANRDKNGQRAPLVSNELESIAESNSVRIQDMLDFERDFELGYFGFKTLEKGYMLKMRGEPVERPQHLFMRVAIGIHGTDWSRVEETYEYLSTKCYTHATPTLFHSGTCRPQMSSCFLLGTEDSVEGIYKTITDCARISKWAGGIGVHISDIRCKGAYIRKTGGVTDGIVPMLRVYNDTSRYINQSGKRNGSFAMYIEPWHGDILDFLEAKKNHGQEEERARDLFYALWIPDNFMRAVEEDGDWYLMCPDMCSGLTSTYGKDFEMLYNRYVSENKYQRKVKARLVWDSIISSQIETGTPYMCYKDHVNRKTNQQNVGVIKSSNLCAEINLYSSDKEYAVCNLASLCLPAILDFPTEEDLSNKGLLVDGEPVVLYGKDSCSYCKLAEADLKRHGILFRKASEQETEGFLTDLSSRTETVPTVPQIVVNGELIGGSDALWELLKPSINWEKLEKMAESVTVNLNRIIDRNFYPTEETRTSNLRHRPLGIGVQGLADFFIQLRLPFTSLAAKKLNTEVFEAIYYSSLTASWSEAVATGKPYDTFIGSPISKGILQFDMWDQPPQLSGRYNWDSLRSRIIRDGIRNSVLLAQMPTASTSQIMGNNECCEPYTSNLYTRRTLAGEFVVVNHHLVRDLENLGIWDQDTRDLLTYDRGSAQRIAGLPKVLKDVYKTVWELSQKDCIQMSADRGKFICQSQSLNLFFDNPEYMKLSAAHMYGWKLGLKTGSYYIRSKPALNSQRFTMDPAKERALANPEPCEMCSG